MGEGGYVVSQPITELGFTIQRPTPSLNRWQRLHWRARQRARVEWIWLVREQVALRRWEPCTDCRTAVSITRYSPGNAVTSRLLDRDNLWGGVKVLVDALVVCELIPDDDDDAIVLTVGQARSGTAATTVHLAPEVARHEPDAG